MGFITFPTALTTKRSGGEFTTLANPQTATKRRAIVTSVDLAPRFVRLVKVFAKIPGFWGTTEFNRIYRFYLLYIEIHISGIFGRISSLTINVLLKKHHVGMVVFFVKNRIKKFFLPKRCVVLLAIPLHSQL